MRKITSKHESSRKQRRNQIIVGVVLVGIMVMSTMGYSFQGDNNEERKINYNGFEFENQGSFWILKLGNKEFIFRNNPEETFQVEGGLNLLNKYSQKPLYLFSDNEQATSRIYTNLKDTVQRMQLACLEEEDCEEDLPIKTCEDNFIIIEENSETSVVQEGNCLFIKGPQEELTSITEGALLKILRVQ